MSRRDAARGWRWQPGFSSAPPAGPRHAAVAGASEATDEILQNRNAARILGGRLHTPRLLRARLVERRGLRTFEIDRRLRQRAVDERLLFALRRLHHVV